MPYAAVVALFNEARARDYDEIDHFQSARGEDLKRIFQKADSLAILQHSRSGHFRWSMGHSVREMLA